MKNNTTIFNLDVDLTARLGEYAATVNNENMQDHYLVTAVNGRQVTSKHKWLKPGDNYITGIFADCFRVECHGKKEPMALLPYSSLRHAVLIVHKPHDEMVALAKSREAERRRYHFLADGIWYESEAAA